MSKGLLMLFTASAHGTIAAAVGQVFRAVGQGLKVCVIQFGHGNWTLGGRMLPDRSKDLLECHVVESNGSGQPDSREGELRAGREAWKLTAEAISSGRFDMVVLENFTRLLSDRIVDPEEFVRSLVHRPANLHVVVTGSDAPPALIEAADLVTEVVTH